MDENRDTKTSEHRRPRMRLWKKLVFALVPLLVCLAAAELVCRILTPVEPEQRALGWRYLQQFHPFLGITRRPNGVKTLDDRYGKRTFTTNRWGYRGPEFKAKKPQGGWRMVCLGGSTTENEFVDDSKTYTVLLQGLLRERTGNANIEVVNAGCATYSTAHSLINYALHASDIDADLVSVYHGINDLVPGMCPGFVPDYAHFYRGYHLATALDTDLQFTLDTPLDSAFGWSALFRLCRKNMTVWLKPRPVNPERVPTRRASRVSGPGPAVFERNLRAIVRLAKANDARVLLCTFPSSLRPGMAQEELRHLGFWTYGWFTFLDVNGVMDGLHRHNAIVQRVAKEDDALLADLAAAVPRDFDHFFDSCHMTPKGQRVAAEALAKIILQAGLIGTPPGQ